MLRLGWWAWILIQTPIAWAQEENPQDCQQGVDCASIKLPPAPPPGGGEGQWVCSGTYGVGGIFREGNRCAEEQIVLDCAGNIVERHRFPDYKANLCPTALGA